MKKQRLFKVCRLLAISSLILVFSGASRCSGPKIKLPDVQFTFGDPVTLSFQLKNEVIVGARLPIPDVEGAFVELVPEFGTQPPRVLFSIPASQFDNDKFRLRDPKSLPDGRPFPSYVDKNLPAVAIEVPMLKHITFYLGKEIAAMFVPTNRIFDPDAEITVSFSDNAGRLVGYITRIPTVNAKNGGFFVAFHWDLAISNPNGGVATIKLQDLQNGMLNGFPYDLSEIFETRDDLQ